MITVAEDVSGMPALCRPIKEGKDTLPDILLLIDHLEL